MSAPLLDTAGPIKPPADEQRAGQAMADILNPADGDAAGMRLAALVRGNPRAQDLLAAVFGASPFLSALVRTMPDAVCDCFERPPAGVLDSVLEDIAAVSRGAKNTGDEAALMKALRTLRNRAALLVGLCDLAGRWDVERAMAVLTRVADGLVRAAVCWLLRDAQAAGMLPGLDPASPETGCGYVVLAMGKQGAGELNYSSDIDLIVLYDRERAPLGQGVEPSQAFVRLTRRLVRLLQERTGDGYALRVDLRLRPDPGATSIAISSDAAAQYYENFGQNWERAAMIKARPVAGDLEMGEEFLARLTPFIWRKYLDFAAIEDIHSIKRQIHAFRGHGAIAVAGHNIKLGRGGIREIEFFVQTQQLIAGGRAETLRGQRTLDMLDALADGRWIARDAARSLARAYRFLRHVEHRLQMLNDEQTQTLPGDERDLQRFARFAGFDDVAAFSAELSGHLEQVQAHYAALFETASPLGDEQGVLVFTGGEDDPGTLETLARMGFSAPGDVAASVRGWHAGRYPSVRSARARELLTELVPTLLKAFAATSEPDRALRAFDAFLKDLPGGVQLFSLLRANPKLLNLIGDIMGAAPRLAQLLSSRPRVLDAVIDPEFFAALPTLETYRGLLDEAFAGARAHEERLDIARIVGREQAFAIGVRVLSGTVDAQDAAAAYSALAQAIVEKLLEAVRGELERAHGTMPGGTVAVVALGKLGSREMAANSDLDLMVIYDFDRHATASSGARPLAGGAYFARLTQRLISALTALTGEGALYQVDMRLRPSGSQGPIATHIDSFIAYQRESAWVWEKLALTRARAIAGDPPLCARVTAAMREALCMAALTRAETAREVARMRARIAREKADFGLWDLKLAPGGLVDVEFIAQFLQIVHGADTPDVLAQNTGEALGKLKQNGFLDARDADDLIAGWRLLHTLSQVLRLCVEGRFEPRRAGGELETLLSRAADVPDLTRLEAALKKVQLRIKTVFDQLFADSG